MLPLHHTNIACEYWLEQNTFIEANFLIVDI